VQNTERGQKLFSWPRLKRLGPSFIIFCLIFTLFINLNKSDIILSMKKNIIRIIIFILCLSICFILGYEIKPTQTLPAKPIRENTDEYSFIHPLLATGISDTRNPTPIYANLAKKVQDFITNQKKLSNIDEASVYFINYGINGFFSFNEDENYAPASLLKVVIMVGYLKESDDNLNKLDKQFTYTSDISHAMESIPFESPTKLKIGYSYSVSDLIDKMITDSDNGAMSLLLGHIDNGYLNEVYTNLGLKAPEDGSTYTISAKEYSIFFRILYNATYLSKNSSEKALSILSKTTFGDGLVKDLPKNIVVAHKFGEHINTKGNLIDSIELHDCGLIYNTKGPYLLCIMTKGKTLESLTDTISKISKIVYDDVSLR